jgi:hypothetical protein
MPAMAIIGMLAYKVIAGKARSYNSCKNFHRLRQPENPE